jgi:hypothetical protein
VYKNKLVRGIFGPKGYEIIGDWRKLHNEELHNLYSSPNCNWNDETKKVEMGRECNTNGVEDECKLGCFGGKPRRK